MRTLLLSIAVLSSSFVCACDEDPDSLDCEELSAEFERLVTNVDRSCDDVAECSLVGGANRSCSASPSLGREAGGRAVNTDAYAGGSRGARLRAIASEFADRCEGRTELCTGASTSCSWDVAPSTLACTDHVCTSTSRSCLTTPGDGGL